MLLSAHCTLDCTVCGITKTHTESDVHRQSQDVSRKLAYIVYTYMYMVMNSLSPNPSLVVLYRTVCGSTGHVCTEA